MQSIADGLPPDVAQRIHPDWRKNEADYWAKRDTLLARFHDTWVAFANGTVIASGSSAVKVFHDGQQSGLHPYVTHWSVSGLAIQHSWPNKGSELTRYTRSSSPVLCDKSVGCPPSLLIVR